MRAVDKHTGGHAHDDMALLLLEHGGPPMDTQQPSLLPPRPEQTSLTMAATAS